MKKDDVELISCKSILLEIKSDVKMLHGKLENVDKIVAVHEQRLNDQEKKVDGLINKIWAVGMGTIISLIAAIINFVFKK